jgi:hypothetical protein
VKGKVPPAFTVEAGASAAATGVLTVCLARGVVVLGRAAVAVCWAPLTRTITTGACGVIGTGWAAGAEGFVVLAGAHGVAPFDPPPPVPFEPGYTHGGTITLQYPCTVGSRMKAFHWSCVYDPSSLPSWRSEQIAADVPPPSSARATDATADVRAAAPMAM